MDESYCPGCGTIGEGSECAPNCDRAPKEQIKQPYSYTLPSFFIEDKEVPTRWRVWAVINGFFIGGQYCWASNEWMADKVKSHKDTVSQAVKELEKMGIVRCVRGARSREIYPLIGANAYQWSAPSPINDRHQRLSISYSNVGKIIPSALEDELRVVEVSSLEREDERPARAPKYPNAKNVFGWFPSQEKSWVLNTTELKHAELLHGRGEQAVKSALAFHKRHSDLDGALKIVKPSDLERKWEDLKDFAKRNGL